MEPKATIRRFFLLVGSSLLAVSSASAQSGTWNVDANGLWGTNTNWLTNIIADGSGFTANFTNDITADRTVSLDSDRTLTSLVFGDSATGTAGSWILDNNGLSTNNLILAGTTPTITVNALGTGKTATISAIIEGTDGLTKAGVGTLIFTGTNTYSGTTTINSGGTLQIGNNSTTGTLGSGSVANNGTLSFYRTDTTTFSNTISGTGSLVVARGGTLTLASGASVTQGNLFLGEPNVAAMGAGTMVVQAGASLNVSGQFFLGNQTSQNGTFNQTGGTVNLTTSAAVGSSTGDIRIGHWSTETGSYNLSGGTLNATGADTTLSWDGTGLIAVSGGTANLRGVKFSTNNKTQTGTLNLSSTGTLNIGAGGLYDGSSGANPIAINFSGGTLGALTGWSSSLAMTLTNTATIDTTGGNIALSGILSSTGALTKNGTGILTLSGAHTYTGATTVNAGRLVMSNQGATNSSSYSVASGAILEMSVASGTRTMATASSLTGTGTFIKSGGGTLIWANAAATWSFGSGALIDVQGGTLTGGSYANEVWTNNKADLNVALGAIFDAAEASNLASGGVFVDALTGAGTVKVGYTAGGPYGNMITFGVDNGSGTFTGSLQNSTTAGNYTKAGTGTQTLSGLNTYTGTTTVNGGTLLLDMTGTGALASTSTLTLGGGIFKVLGKSGAFTTTQTLGALTVNAGGSQIVLDANGGTSTTLTLANSAPTRAAGGTFAVDLSIANTVLTSTLGLTAGTQTNTQAVLGYATVKDATGTGFATNVGGNIVRYTGADELLAASNSSTTNYKITPVGTTTTGSPLLTTTASAVYNSLSIDTSGATGANFLSLNGTVSLTRNALLMTGGNDFTIQGGTQLGAAASEVIVHQAGAGTLTISSLISSGAGSLTKTGSGILVLTGNNAYTGTTRISGGELRLSGGAYTTAARTYQIDSGAVLSFSGSNQNPNATTTVIQGTGTLRILNGGSIFAGASNRRVNMNLGAGAVIDVQAGGSFGFGYQPIVWTNNKASLNMDGNHNMWDDNAIIADALTGAGTIGSSFTGGSTSLTIGTANGSGTFSGAIIHGMSGGTRTIALTKNGTGTQTLSGANTYIGATTISAGTLLVNGTHITTTGSNTYTVSNSGSTLGGTGRIAINGAITVASTATLAPGVSIGNLTLDGANVTGNVLTMSTGSNFGFELDGSGGISDQLALWNYLSGDIVLNNNTLNLSLLGTQAAGTYNVDIFRFFSNAGTTATTHAFSSGLTIGTLGTGISTASIDWNGTGDNSQSIALSYTVIPEPHVALLSGLGVLLILRRRRN